MADFPVPEKLLRGMTVDNSIASGNGVTVYELTHAASGQRFVLKHISIPASEEKVDALILSGAYADREEAGRYYQHMAEDLVREVQYNRALSECPNILRFLSYQLAPHEGGVGYDLYTITARQTSLRQYRQKNAMSHLTALNLGIDLCTALEAIHAAGFVFQDLRPGNVFLTESGRFLLGDFGLASMQDMQYSSLPEQFLSEYSAPELGGVLTGLNPTIDIYSLGMLLYRIYNGYHAPFEDEQSGAGASEERRRAGEALPAPLYADYELAAILGKACAFDPKERYQTPGELRVALTDYMLRNAVDDSLIVPPIVSGDGPLLEEVPDDEPEPVRFANVEELDEDFKTHFSPDTGGLNAVIAAVRKEEAKESRQRTAAPVQSEEAPEPDPDEPKKEPVKKAVQPAKKTPKPKKKGRVVCWILLGLLAVVLATGALYCFTPLGHELYEFDIVVDSIQITDITTDSLTAEIRSNAEAGLLTASCQDAYGNAISKPVGDGPVTFEALTPGTQYTVNLSLTGFHRLSGVTSAGASTVSVTEVLTFAVAAAPEEGVATVSLVVKDGAAEPEEWTLSIEAAGQTPRTQQFTGHSAQVTGLTVGTAYTLRLLDGDALSLTGQTETQYTPLAVIKAEQLTLDGLLDGTASLSWRCTSALPTLWTLSVEAPDGAETDQPVAETEREPEADGSYRCTAQVAGIEAGQTYVFRLSAEGMFQSLSYTLDASRPYISAFTAQQTDEGIVLHWDATATPAGGWRLTVEPGGSEALRRSVDVDGESYTLRYQFGELLSLLPGTAYRFTLSGRGEQQPLGYTDVAAEAVQAAQFSGLKLDIMNTYTGLYAKPEGEDWGGDTLMGRDARTSFRAGDPIEILLRNRSGVGQSEETVELMFLVRNSAGELVSVRYDKQAWDELWDGRNCVLELPDAPVDAGDYTVEIYFNNALVRSFDFTVVEP